MTNFFRPVGVLVWKDILLELRSRELIVSMLVFGLMLVVVFNFALSVTPQRVTTVAPGILWASFAFAGVLAMSRAFAREREQGGLDGLLITPVSRDSIFLGKAASIFLFMVLVEAILLPIFAGLMGFSAVSFALLFTILLASAGFALVGALFAAIAVQTKSREILLPVLFFPVVLPVIVGAVEATKLAIGGESVVGIGHWLPLIGAFDAVFLVICPWVFSLVVEE